jgi:hypothetical protein
MTVDSTKATAKADIAAQAKVEQRIRRMLPP